MVPVVKVLIDGPSDLEFYYGIPEACRSAVAVGSRVHVPLRARQATGTVLSVEELEEPPRGLKPFRDLIEGTPVLTEKLVELGRWISGYYACSMESVMRSLIPQAVRGNAHSHKTLKAVRKIGGPEDEEASKKLARRARRQAEILTYLDEVADGQPVTVKQLEKELGGNLDSSIKSLLARGWLETAEERVDRNPHRDEEFLESKKLVLNDEQEVALTSILEAVENPESARPILVHGVTGSGKTEVYLQAVEQVIESGRSAIVLVPEISLTPQTVGRFKSRFASMQDSVAVLHSHLSQGERFDEWHKIQRREAKIVIGARSAIFAPLDNLGLIVVDEEHETSYKQENPPRYHGRDIAVLRAHLENCAVVLGSATPSLESWNNCLRKKYELVELKQRVDDRSLPLIRIVDMRLEARKGSEPSIISERLRKAVNGRLEKGEQTILFLNRRGFATSLVCPGCGHVCECRHCSVPLTFHRQQERLLCHICGFQQIAPKRCPECKDPGIRFAGYGTEKVESVLKKVFPSAKSARVDADSMSRKNALRDTLNAFKTQKLDLLIGTQMIAKGLHFPNVTLVGILNADLGLHMPDFRAGERTFQLITQVAGRAGRGEMEGEVFVQTFTPHSPSVQFARHHDFEGYAEQELQFRKQFHYPPFHHAVLVMVRCPHERRGEFTIENVYKRLLDQDHKGILLGQPAASPLVRANNQFRFQFLMRAARTAPMTKLLNRVINDMTFPDDVYIGLDVDPFYMM